MLQRGHQQARNRSEPFPRVATTMRVNASQSEGCRSSGATSVVPTKPGRNNATVGDGESVSVSREGLLHEARSAAPGAKRSASTRARAGGLNEIIGGGERLADLDLMLQRIKNTICRRNP